MTMAAVFAVLWPLRGGRAIPLPGSDLAVYRDQIEEIERDQAAGRIGAAEAEAARIEVSRRLIAAADAAETMKRPGYSGLGVKGRRIVAAVALFALPLGAGASYLVSGSPDIPAQPLAERKSAPGQERSVANMVAQIEAHLERNPEDGRGWEVVAPVYLRIGRFDDAVKARSNALRILGANGERETDYGEALVAAANGVVTADAMAAFERALALESDNIKARFYLGISAEQDGKREEAARIFRGLLQNAPAGASWTGFVREALARLEGGETASPRGPSAEEEAAASQMNEEQRGEMIRGMVARLAERLKNDGSDPDGWLRLVRAYMVLGERERARTAVSEARRTLANEPEKLRRLEDGVKGLGIEG